MKTVVIVSQDIVIVNLAEGILKKLYYTIVFTSIQAALDYIYNSIPSLVVVDIELDDSTTVGIINDLKDDPIFSQLPFLAILSDTSLLKDLAAVFVEDYLWEKDLGGELLARVNLAIDRSERIVEINPLTHLPGNISINRQIEERLENGVLFAFAYADLDFFKPFNDKYGFSRGDEVIKITGRIILNVVKNRQRQGSFVGHIGGDDFVYIMDIQQIEETSQEIIDSFNRLIPSFYDLEDRNAGFIASLDRRGKKNRFPIMGISIGITDNQYRKYFHYGELTEAASEMKKHAKKSRGSSYSIDKRRQDNSVKDPS
ncbi:MAG: diguanylate cyclase [Deltaproteobacteria bacterium]|nr:diguanylate cyclase [Deltaproteobacteria bacterium]